MFIPLTVGGGVRTVDRDARRAAGRRRQGRRQHGRRRRPDLIAPLRRPVRPPGASSSRSTRCADRARAPGRSSSRAAASATGLDAVAWAQRAVELGAGELLVTSIDRDGTGIRLRHRAAAGDQLDGRGARSSPRAAPPGPPTSWRPSAMAARTRSWRRRSSTGRSTPSRTVKAAMAAAGLPVRLRARRPWRDARSSRGGPLGRLPDVALRCRRPGRRPSSRTRRMAGCSWSRTWTPRPSRRPLATGEVHFHSRSRGRLWRKGETSGNVLRLVGSGRRLRRRRPARDRGSGRARPATAGRGAASIPIGAPAERDGPGFAWLETLWATIADARRRATRGLVHGRGSWPAASTRSAARSPRRRPRCSSPPRTTPRPRRPARIAAATARGPRRARPPTCSTTRWCCWPNAALPPSAVIEVLRARHASRPSARLIRHRGAAMHRGRAVPSAIGRRIHADLPTPSGASVTLDRSTLNAGLARHWALRPPMVALGARRQARSPCRASRDGPRPAATGATGHRPMPGSRAQRTSRPTSRRRLPIRTSSHSPAIGSGTTAGPSRARR